MRCPDAGMANPRESAQHFSRLNPGLYELSYRSSLAAKASLTLSRFLFAPTG